MKKHLLFGFAAFASLAIVAQNTHRSGANLKARKMVTFKSEVTAENLVKPATVQNKVQKTAGAPYKRIGGSTNIFGVVVSDSRVVQYNETINTVGFVYRKGATWTGVTDGNSGTICYAYSPNNGSTWDSTIMAASATYLHRYPTGTIYNPAGNTNPTNAYAVVSGPWHPGSNWQGVYFGSKQMTVPGDNNNGNVTYIDNLALTSTQRKQDFARIDMQATSNGNVYVLGGIYDDINGTTAAAQGWRGAMINKGVFSGGSFTWTLDSLKPSFRLDSNGDKNGYTSSNMAWSEDGQIGYVIFYGVDANATDGTSQNSFQPYAYKTTNGGATWARHAALFDFTTLPEVNNRLFTVKSSSTLAKPFIAPGEGSSATVDANGKLHLFITLSSASSDHIDSLGYSYSPNFSQTWNYLFDFTSTSTGWSAMLIDSLNCEGPSSTNGTVIGTSNWTSSGDPYGYDARLQISRTTDGNHIVYSWADSDSTVVTDHQSTLPDVFMQGYDVVNNKMTCKKNMSLGKTDFHYYSYWFFASPRIAKPSGTTFQIPVTVTKSDDASNNGDIAVSHYYMDDAMFSASDFSVTVNTAGCSVGIKENASSVANLNFYPNPASTNGTIEVVLNENAKMDVVVMNAVGQTVMTKAVDGFAGNNKVDVNTSNLTSGIYFYQVKIANSKTVTKKFVVEK